MGLVTIREGAKAGKGVPGARLGSRFVVISRVTLYDGNRPIWMDSLLYERSIDMTGRNKDELMVVRSVTCKGCGLPFVKVDGRTDLAFYIHCIDQCDDYKKLGLIRRCEPCGLKFHNKTEWKCHDKAVNSAKAMARKLFENVSNRMDAYKKRPPKWMTAFQYKLIMNCSSKVLIQSTQACGKVFKDF